MSLRYRLALAPLLLLVACGGDSAADTPTTPTTPTTPGAPRTAEVTMGPAFFLPPSTTIAVNGTVTFDFFGGVDHNVLFERKAGAPADIQQTRNVRITRTFATAGTFPYDCRIHPGMVGEIVVVR